MDEFDLYDINSGDVVTLKSGGLEMTVAKIFDREALCIWFCELGGGIYEKEIPLPALLKIR